MPGAETGGKSAGGRGGLQPPSGQRQNAAATLLSRGAKGGAVRRLQRALRAAGYLLVVDGIFGPATQAAVRQYQRDHGLEVDGVVGPRTWVALADTPGQSAPGVPESAEQRGGIAGGVLTVALSELAAGAREVGGQNRGTVGA